MKFKRDKKQNSNKLRLDKYYTDKELAKYLIKKTYQIIGKDNILEAIEPSAGSGAFSSQINNCIAYDIEPEGGGIIKQDFLRLKLSYKKGRLFIGNPPFGDRNRLSVQFFKQCILMGDYIAFILPISQLNNNQQMYEFDLVYSENLGDVFFTDRKIKVCFNIYKRPKNKLNKKPKNESKNIAIYEIRNQNKPIPEKYDLSICAWGGAIGTIFDVDNKRYAKEFFIKIKNKDKKDEILKIFESTNWCDSFIMTSTPNLSQWQVFKVIDFGIK